MNPQGQLTSAVARSITEEITSGYDVYYDHNQAGEFVGTIAVSLDKDLARASEISQVDIAIIERDSNKIIALIEIEETTDHPKTLIGDIFATLMGNSVHLPGKKGANDEKRTTFVGEWTTLVIIAKGLGHEKRYEYIKAMAIRAKSVLGTENSRIGDIAIASFSPGDNLENIVMEQIKEAIKRIS